ncbi:hypothetical protein ACR780_02095 [Sphingobacterium faecium]|uniref:hypothetical protein n=1 Tax=Sphingobacterium faecium TaxID=34087 RepID=UPI003DA3A89F
MIGKKLKNILSLNGISLIVGISGGILAFVTLSVADLNIKIELRWFILLSFIFFIFLLISFKLINDLFTELKFASNFSHAISYISGDSLLLVEINKNFDYSAITTIFYIKNGVEIVLGTGYVSNIQQKLIQIKLINFDVDFQKNNTEILKQLNDNNADIIKNIIVKNHSKFIQ